MEDIKVSVCMISFNHNKYIEKAIKSILMQKTDFNYEIVIGDDASTDGTQQIIYDLANEHPCIKPILRQKNLGITPNLLDTLSKCKGEYIAFLDGDDFWTDPHKLKKQVDFLDNNPDYVACYHATNFVDENDCTIDGCKNDFCTHSDYTIEDLCDFLLPGQTATAMGRRLILIRFYDKEHQKIVKRMRYTPLDRSIAIYLLSCGKVYCFQEAMSAYRVVNAGNNWSSRYNTDDIFGHWVYTNMRREMELIGQDLGIDIDLKEKEYDAFIDACWKYKFGKKRSYLVNVAYMYFFSRRKDYLHEKGVPKVKTEIEIRKKVKKEHRRMKKDEKLRSIKGKCQRLIILLKKLKTVLLKRL